MMPTATAKNLAFLFTDIEGSSIRWEHQRAAMSAALVRHDELLRRSIEGHGGHVFKTMGDAFYGAFADAAAALDAALDGQRAIAAEDWSAFGPNFADLRVRMAIHLGEVEARGGDFFGPALNRTARLMAVGHGGQVLLSLAARQVVSDYLPEGVTLRDWGEHRLKGQRRPEHIWQVLDPVLQDVARSPATISRLAARDRIVVDETGVERAPEETLAAMLAAVRSDERAVTLTMPQIRQVLERRVQDLTEYRLGRIAEWSQPRYRLDRRFVALTLLVDRGEAVAGDRWVAKEETYDDMDALLSSVADPALVVLGPSGCGKSTLLRHLELEKAISALRGEDARETVTFFVQLNQYRPAAPGEPVPSPERWLADRWSALFPDLRPLDDWLSARRVILLLDALNEMPARSEAEFRERVGLWKDWLARLTKEKAGNRVVISCRTLDYSAPLSTPALRVPQVRIEPLTDEQVREFLVQYSPVRGEAIWAAIAGTAQLEALRSPFFLALLVDQVEGRGELARDRAGLFTGFVRQALRREVERDNPLFALEALLSKRDVMRIAQWQWRDPYELPERGALVPKLSRLAHGMQAGAAGGEASQVRVAYDRALELVGHEQDEGILKAGVAIGVLDEDPAADEVLFRHQLLQEYFAARQLAACPDPELVRLEWQADRLSPRLDDVIDSLVLADPLPGVQQMGWEETTLLAAAMAEQPERFVRGIMDANLALAGRIACRPEVGARLPEALIDELRWALVRRSRDPTADLRYRIACGYAAGSLGDPRYERRSGPYGEYLWPPLIELPGGVYPIGDDEPIEWTSPRTGESGTDTDHMPRHDVEIAPFRIGQFAVTNAEWASFMASGGYEHERWWDTADARLWQRGQLANETAKHNNRVWRRRFRDDPTLFDRMIEEGVLGNEASVERWRGWMALDDGGFERALEAHWQPKRRMAPTYWHDERYNRPSQPVVGVCWYEARAYCNWLSAQAGLAIRMPTEVEWEAAARGREAREYPWGDGFDRLKANTYETHVRRPTPVGVFPDGDTPDGLADLSGNTFDWTSSMWGEWRSDASEVGYRYPYDATDGREDAEAPCLVARVLRGGSWIADHTLARAANRNHPHPDQTHLFSGLRLVSPVC